MVRPLAFLVSALLVAAAGASLFFVHSLQPTSAKAAVFFSIWLLFPYLILAVILAFNAWAAIRAADLAVTLIVVSGGLLFLTVVIFVRPDPQGGIAVLFTPIYQLVAMGALFPLSHWIFGRRSA